MGRAEDLENPDETEESGTPGSGAAGDKGVVEGVEELQLSANLTEKEQLRCVLVFAVLLTGHYFCETLFVDDYYRLQRFHPLTHFIFTFL